MSATREHRLGAVRVQVASRDRPPFEVDAVAIEDDTYSVLSSDPEFREPTEHPIRIWTAVHEMEPAETGSVSVKPGEPVKLLAVVHDLSADPTWKEEWVARALDEVFRCAEELGTRHLGLEALGAMHGRLPLERFLELLGDTLERHAASVPDRLWLIAPKGREGELEAVIDSL